MKMEPCSIENKDVILEAEGKDCERDADRIKPTDVAFMAVEMGKSIIQSGGEISRAEDTMTRICRAYGADSVDVAVIMSVIVLTVEFGEDIQNISRHVKEVSSNNLGKLAKFNDFSRRICRDRPSRSDFEEELAFIEKKSRIPIWKKYLGGILAAVGFSVFFGGGVLEALMAGLVVIPMTLIGMYLDRIRVNAIIAKFVVCLFGGILTMMTLKTGIGCDVNVIIIADIMTVVPGVLLANSFRDLFSGDIMSGFFRLCTAVLDAVSIACGYAVAILIMGGAI